MSANINGNITAICNQLIILSSFKNLFMLFIIHESYCSEKRDNHYYAYIYRDF